LNDAKPGTVCVPASSNTVGGLLAVKLGASLTALTVIVTVATLESSVPSLAL